jgi:hypothetical protein
MNSTFCRSWTSTKKNVGARSHSSNNFEPGFLCRGFRVRVVVDVVVVVGDGGFGVIVAAEVSDKQTPAHKQQKVDVNLLTAELKTLSIHLKAFSQHFQFLTRKGTNVKKYNYAEMLPTQIGTKN